MTGTEQDHWKKCSVCKKPIGFGEAYYVCSVSTCGGNRTGYVFCRIQCFETHLPGARHRDAGAVEMKAPSKSQPEALVQDRSPARLIVRTPVAGSVNTAPAGSTGHYGGGKALPREVLVVASRLKEYITARSDMNTSASVMEVLSDHLRMLADRAIDNARVDGRRTVMDRDLEFIKSLK